MDQNIYNVIENIENENVIELNYDVANTYHISAHLSNNSLQQLFGNRVLLMLTFHQLECNATYIPCQR